MLFNSPRLNFRELKISDAPWFKALNDDAEVLKYTGDFPFENLAAAQEFLKNYDHYNQHGFGRWAVILRDTNQKIGWCGLKLNKENKIDLGFRFFKKYWNQGFATEACIACVNFGFNDLHILEIIGRTAKSNVAAQRVLTKAGLKYYKSAEVQGIGNAQYYSIKNSFLD